MNEKRKFKQCMKSLIDKIDANYDYIITMRFDFDPKNEYLKGKADGIIETSNIIEEAYEMFFGDDEE